MHERMHIEAFKEELAWVIDKWLRVICNKMLFETVTVFIRIKAGLIYTQGLKYMPGNAAE